MKINSPLKSSTGSSIVQGTYSFTSFLPLHLFVSRKCRKVLIAFFLNWRVLFGTQTVETEGVSKSGDIEINPKADSHPGTN